MGEDSRRTFLVVAGVLLVAPCSAIAQRQPPKIARIGFLGAASASTYVAPWEAFKAGLRDLGYVEGKNIEFEIRWAEGRNDRLSKLAAELVRRKVDVIVTHGTEGTLAAKQITKTIPIVSVAMADPVASGIVESFARPGANVTGVAILSNELYVKRLALLKEALPHIRRVGFLMNPDNPVYEAIFQSTKTAATSLGVELQRFDVRGANELNGVFAAMAKARVDAVEITEDSSWFSIAISIADLATKQRLPSVSGNQFTGAGVLVGYGVSRLHNYRRAAGFVDKILRGAKAGDLPIEQPTEFELVINGKTAKALGITIPKELLLRVDRVIE